MQDTYEFAYCYPYSLTDIILFVNSLESRFHSIVKRQTLTYSTQGRPVDLLSISCPAHHAMLKGITGTKIHSHKKLPCIFISARIHPGESPASFVCEGDYWAWRWIDA